MNIGVKNILDELDRHGEEKVRRDLSFFSCPVNPSIENFIRRNAINFSLRRVSITYLVNDTDDGAILGFFALTHKAVLIPADWMSNTSRKRIERYAKFDKPTNSYMTSAFLIAQLGKNYGVDDGKRISGGTLMSIANDILTDIQRRIGGGIIYLDCEDVEMLKQFYGREKFQKFGERFSEEENQKYHQYMRFLQS